MSTWRTDDLTPIMGLLASDAGEWIIGQVIRVNGGAIVCYKHLQTVSCVKSETVCTRKSLWCLYYSKLGLRRDCAPRQVSLQPRTTGFSIADCPTHT